MKCGLCLPHCPTYNLSQNEAQSPRGRIALMQGLASGLLEQSATVEQHLDQCLTCRACEPVCPAQVPYGELIDQGRALLQSNRRQVPAASSRLLTQLLSHTTLRRITGRLLWLYQCMGLQWLLRKTHLLGRGELARVEAFLPALPRPRLPSSGPTSVKRRGRVALFTGCVSEWLESDVLADAVTLLQACGFDVEVPTDQGCCGALFQHQGQLQKSRQLAAQNLQAFSGEYLAILGTASGCTSMLAEYPLLTDKADNFSGLVQDINQFLLTHWPGELQLRELSAHVVIHDPCSLRNTLKTAQAPYQLLEKIPGMVISPLDDNATCCGAAGNYFITQAEMAEQLGAKKRQAVQRQQPDIVLSSNVGCSMQLKATINKTGLNIPVLHPISLLRQQLVD